MYSLQKIKSFFRHPILFYNALRYSGGQASDIARWREKEELKASWDGRTIMIAKLIPPAANVLEFGAARLVLSDHLDETCRYQPSDIIDRGRSTLVCDLNMSFPELRERYTHTVFSGVLEYLSDIGTVVCNLKKHTDFVIASYQTTDHLSCFVTRRAHGWINHLSHEQLVDSFTIGGFTLKEIHYWNMQTIYVFKNAK